MCERGAATYSDVQAGRMAGEDAIRLPRGSQWGAGRCTGARVRSNGSLCVLVGAVNVEGLGLAVGVGVGVG